MRTMRNSGYLGCLPGGVCSGEIYPEGGVCPVGVCPEGGVHLSPYEQNDRQV